jgi:hypothetical protein
MTTTNQLIEQLQDHLPYELLMLRYTHARMQAETHDLVFNTMYECFCMHARNMWDFLHNEGTGNNLKVKEFAKEYRAPEDQKAQRIINFDMQGQVFHFGKSRPSKQTDKVGLEKCKAVFDYIEKAFSEFMAADWNDPSLKAKFDHDRADPTNVEQLIEKKGLYVYVGGPPAASSGGLQIARSIHEGYTGPAPREQKKA